MPAKTSLSKKATKSATPNHLQNFMMLSEQLGAIAKDMSWGAEAPYLQPKIQAMAEIAQDWSGAIKKSV
jgi:hypothetical protein